MGKPIDVTKEQDRFAALIREALQARGSVELPLSELVLDVEVYRQVARRVGRELGRRVRTFVLDETRLVLLANWAKTGDPDTDERENEVLMLRMRSALATSCD